MAAAFARATGSDFAVTGTLRSIGPDWLTHEPVCVGVDETQDAVARAWREDNVGRHH